MTVMSGNWYHQIWMNSLNSQAILSVLRSPTEVGLAAAGTVTAKLCNPFEFGVCGCRAGMGEMA